MHISIGFVIRPSVGLAIGLMEIVQYQWQVRLVSQSLKKAKLEITVIHFAQLRGMNRIVAQVRNYVVMRGKIIAHITGVESKFYEKCITCSSMYNSVHYISLH